MPCQIRSEEGTAIVGRMFSLLWLLRTKENRFFKTFSVFIFQQRLTSESRITRRGPPPYGIKYHPKILKNLKNEFLDFLRFQVKKQKQQANNNKKHPQRNRRQSRSNNISHRRTRQACRILSITASATVRAATTTAAAATARAAT